MSRARTDQACLEAQMQQQIAQNLNAELAVACPDCGVESGRACRGDFNREVRTHLARSVAANRRDTKPCPAPVSWQPGDPNAMVPTPGRLVFIGTPPRHGKLEYLRELQTAWAEPDDRVFSQESLTRAAAREFAKNRQSEIVGEWLETAQTGGDFFAIDKTPAASERAPAIAPEVVPFHGPSITEMLSRPTCACGQTVWKDNAEINGAPACSDCAMSTDFLFWKGPPAPLDKRIAETKSDDAAECAWSTPTSDGEGWR